MTAAAAGPPQKPKGVIEMFDHYNDDDVKIAPEDLSKLFDRGNPVADDNIDLFLRQRSNGNTARAPEARRAICQRPDRQRLDPRARGCRSGGFLSFR